MNTRIIFYYFFTLFCLISCSDKKDKVIAVAKDYVENSICSLFEKAEVSKYLTESSEWGYGIINDEKPILMKDLLKAMEYVNSMERASLTAKKSAAKYGIFPKDEKEWREYHIKEKLNTNSNDAIKEAVKKGLINNGFYIVPISIKYGESQYNLLNIIVSKEFEVLNAPVDLEEIDRYKEISVDSFGY